ncbi:hypothetical protein D3C86_2179440 [compost metagenome]
MLVANYGEGTVALDWLPDINPASGLPILNGFDDVAGNLYGMNNCATDCSDTSLATDTFI